jgi:hypothetical protein
VSTAWEVANKCPRDGAFTGKVVNRKGAPGGGQLVTLECPETNCEYHDTGWVVQIRPDNTIPDKLDLSQREKQFKNTLSQTAMQQVRDALAQQVANEMKPGYEVENYR